MNKSTPDVGFVPKQMFLPLFTQHENQALAETIEARERTKWARREKALQKSPTAKRHFAQFINDLQPDFLVQPIGQGKASEFDESLDEPLLLTPIDAHTGEVNEWSEDAVMQLHEATLHYSLAVLDSRGNAQEKKEILQWIFNPPEFHRLVDGRWQVIHQAEMPFGFDLCCRICGLNPDRLRDGLENVLRNLTLGATFKEIQSGNTKSGPQGLPSSIGIRFAPGAGKCDDSRNGGGSPRRADEGQALSV